MNDPNYSEPPKPKIPSGDKYPKQINVNSHNDPIK